jgi:CheY-like chemotaxis protein
MRPDVAVVDIGLPLVDGYEIARQVRANPILCETRLVALTGYGQPEDRQRALDSGFDVHLVKPVDLASLVRVMAELRPTDSASAGATSSERMTS